MLSCALGESDNMRKYKFITIIYAQNVLLSIQLCVKFQLNQYRDLVCFFYLSDTTCRTSELYLLPKIHKNKNPPPGRPIISANGSPTEKISQFVDHFLNPTTFNLPSYVRDTTHFLQIISGIQNLPPDTLLVTLDVESLYTNIPTPMGLEAARKALNKSRPSPNVQPTNNSLVKLLEMVLTKNNFQFNGQHYLQIKGTAMGTKAAVAYANTTLGFFEDKFVYTYKVQPLLYKRFIDDIFIIWTQGRDKLDDFISHLNNCDSNFRFTQDISEHSIHFLDTTISISNNGLKSDLYSKPTDSHNYLRYDSAHPQRCKDSIPYSQFLRIRRICSDTTDYIKHAKMYEKYFLAKDYPKKKLIKEAAELALSKDRNTLLNPTHQKDTNKDAVFLISTYHPHCNYLKEMVQKNWNLLGRNSTTEFLYQKRLICGYRRPKNLRDLLMKAKVSQKPGDTLSDPTYTKPTTQNPTLVVTPACQVKKQSSITDFFTSRPKAHTFTPTPSLTNLKATTSTTSSKPTPFHQKNRGFNFCNRNACRYCPLLDKSGKISNTCGEHFTTMKNVSCRSSNLIYCITCTKCSKQYVGQTMLRLKDRFIHHFRDVEQNIKDKTVGRHFNLPNHDGTKDMKITVLEFIKKNPRSPQAVTIRNRRENSWTNTLRSHAPNGLNMENPKEYKTHLKK